MKIGTFTFYLNQKPNTSDYLFFKFGEVFALSNRPYISFFLYYVYLKVIIFSLLFMFFLCKNICYQNYNLPCKLPCNYVIVMKLFWNHATIKHFSIVMRIKMLYLIWPYFKDFNDNNRLNIHLIFLIS